MKPNVIQCYFAPFLCALDADALLLARAAVANSQAGLIHTSPVFIKRLFFLNFLNFLPCKPFCVCDPVAGLVLAYSHGL